MSRPDPMSSVTPCLLVNAYAYSPYGLLGSYETIENAFQYVGRFGVMAEGNGLYFMRARYYDPDVGRFINKDPIGYAGGMNLYGYVGGNPVNWTDSWGLDPRDPRTGKDNPVLRCHVCTHNDPTENLYGAVIVFTPLAAMAAGPVAAVVARIGPPVMAASTTGYYRIAAPFLADPQKYRNATDFLLGVGLVGPAPPSWGGYGGAFLQLGVDWASEWDWDSKEESCQQPSKRSIEPREKCFYCHSQY